MPKRTKAPIDQRVDVAPDQSLQAQVTAIYRDAAANAKKIAAATESADAPAELNEDGTVKRQAGWKVRLFEVAKQCENAAEFEGLCKAAAKAYKGQKPRNFTQAQSDILAGWRKHGLNPSDFDTYSQHKEEKKARNKAEAEAKAAAESDPETATQRETTDRTIPARLMGLLDSLAIEASFCLTGDHTDRAQAILEQTLADMRELRKAEAELETPTPVEA